MVYRDFKYIALDLKRYFGFAIFVLIGVLFFVLVIIFLMHRPYSMPHLPFYHPESL